MGSVKGKCLDQHLQYVVEIIYFYKQIMISVGESYF